MIKRTIDISDGPNFLFVENDQLVISREKTEVGRVPAEDVGVLLVDHVATTYTHSAMTRLLERGAVVVFCGPNHLPAGILLPVENNGLVVERLRAQIDASEPLKKQLWKQIVQHKIRGQAANLPADHPTRGQLLDIAGCVKSGDTSNCEGQAGRFYWPALMGSEFRRDPEGEPPNGLLNYGYTVFRAACARALVSAGLNCALGLHHSNRANAFCLADDLVEVFRPRVDAAVLELARQDVFVLERPAKKMILGLLVDEITLAGQSGPLMVQLHRMVASLVRCYEGLARELELPE
jgi:CRISPR-associated protein Cas1